MRYLVLIAFLFSATNSYAEKGQVCKVFNFKGGTLTFLMPSGKADIYDGSGWVRGRVEEVDANNMRFVFPGALLADPFSVEFSKSDAKCQNSYN